MAACSNVLHHSEQLPSLKESEYLKYPFGSSGWRGVKEKLSMAEKLEWKTRRDRINTKLKALTPAWSIIKYRDGLDASKLLCHAVEEFPTANGPADYALFVRGRLVGIIEAKKVGVGPQMYSNRRSAILGAPLAAPASGTVTTYPFFIPRTANSFTTSTSAMN